MNRSEYNKNYWIENKSSIQERRLKRREANKIYQARYYQRTKLKRAKEYQEKKIK
tara:strand:+ start:638 stop:802 length:165 start_codon:yes stop_codon:yes gene_type:complete